MARGIVAVILALIAATALFYRPGPTATPAAPAAPGWTIVKGADPDSALTFNIARIRFDLAKERHIYDDAVSRLCRDDSHKPICIIGFYLPGDPTPSSTRYLRWDDTKPVAVWWSNDNSGVASYTTWDCARGPEQHAPLSALCGQGIIEANLALLTLGSRDGIGEACGWPPRKTAARELIEILSWVRDPQQREFLRDTYNQSRDDGRTIRTHNPGYDCGRYLPVIEKVLPEKIAAWRSASATPTKKAAPRR